MRVYERSGDYLMLVLMLDAGDELSQDVVEPLLLEYVSPRGLVRFHGQAIIQERDLVRFDVSAAPEVTQRREFVRVPAVQKVEVAKGHGRAGADSIDAPRNRRQRRRHAPERSRSDSRWGRTSASASTSARAPRRSRATPRSSAPATRASARSCSTRSLAVTASD